MNVYKQPSPDSNGNSGSSWAVRCAAAGAGRDHRDEMARHVRAHSLPAFNSPAKYSIARAVIAIIVNVGF